MASAKHRSRFVLLTFSKHYLRFWRVDGEPVVHRAGDPLWNCAADCLSSIPAMREEFAPGKSVSEKKWPPTEQFRTLPVKLLAEVERRTLYTSIDSLAVYQYLNRGTCRPLWRISGPTGAELRFAPAPPDDVYRHGNLSLEEPFAAFVRLYLGGILRRECPQQFGEQPFLGEVDSDLTVNTMNPILVETAALAFCQDLGLTPDIGVGKGKDVVDIRARAAGSEGLLDLVIADRAAKDLAAALALADCPDHARVVSRLRLEGVLDIQCKAGQPERSLGDGVDFGRVLHFGFFNEEYAKKRTVLFLRRLPVVSTARGVSDRTSALGRFLAMQEQVLRGRWGGAEQPS